MTPSYKRPSALSFFVRQLGGVFHISIETPPSPWKSGNSEIPLACSRGNADILGSELHLGRKAEGRLCFRT